MSRNTEETAAAENEIEKKALKIEYKKYATECHAALRLTLARIENLKEALELAGMKDPFFQIETRIKSFESAEGKCKARGYGLDIESIRKNIKDVAGIRVITKYIDDVQKASSLLENIQGLTVICKKDYVTAPKQNGYSSIHLNCQVEVYTGINGGKLIPVEIQIRSLSTELWSIYEHDLKYKNENPSPEADESFRRAAEFLRQFDEEMMAFRDHREVSKKNKITTKKKENATTINMV